MRRLETHREAAPREVGETTCRVWRLYMAGCALKLDRGSTGIYQMLALRRGAEPALPLTRDDPYAPLSGQRSGAAALSVPAP